MTRFLYIFIAVVAFAYIALCAVMYAYQGSLTYNPRPRGVTAAESTMRLKVDGADLVVTVRRHSGSKAIVYFGGNGEDVSTNLESYTQAFPEHALYFLHYRSYGGSTGKPSEKANISDAMALLRQVHDAHSDISIIGRSLGTGIAIQVAAQEPTSHLILITPYDSLADIAASLYPWLPVQWLLRDRYDSKNYAHDIETPTTIIIAENDEVIPRESTRRLVDRFRKGVRTTIVIPGVGHNDVGVHPQLMPTLQAALQQ